jgi:hypothetical protein
LADTWSIYLDAGERLRLAHSRLATAADSLLAVGEAELASN